MVRVVINFFLFFWSAPRTAREARKFWPLEAKFNGANFTTKVLFAALYPMLWKNASTIAWISDN